MMALDLTGLWRFQPDPSGTGLLQGYASTDYDDHRWREVWVPTDFETCHPGLDTYEGAGWFRRWVTVPTEWDDRRVVLRFEGTNAHARVWLNEQEVGAWDFPFLPYAMDVHRALTPLENRHSGRYGAYIGRVRASLICPGMKVALHHRHRAMGSRWCGRRCKIFRL